MRDRYLMALAATLTLTPLTPVAAGTQGAGPLALEMTLASSRTITIGEPIVLHYKITDASNAYAVVYQGPGLTDWHTEKITDADGHPLPAPLAVKATPPHGIFMDSTVLESNASTEGYLVVSRPSTFTYPGDYALAVHVRLPYGTGDTARGIPSSRIEKTFGTVFTRDYRFVLAVAPADLTRLSAIAETMRQEIAADKTGSTTRPLVQALFSLPQEAALPIWQRIAADPTLSVLVYGNVAHELSHVLTPESADLLAGMLWGPAQPPSVVSQAYLSAELLQGMYLAGDYTLRQHVRRLFADHGLTVSDKPSESIHD